MAIEIENSPVVKMAAHGYTPFTPDAGILCGGYQGPLYPNPTTLLTNLDLREFINPVIDEYTMKSEPDFYEGLGSGNPGIDYRNAGHIIGLLDTFSRMSYGLRVLQAIRESSLQTSFGPAIEISIPLINLDLTINGIGDIDLYPDLSENPTDYISSFIGDNGFLLLDPRIDEPFIFDSNIHSPATSLISEQILRIFFKDVKTDSYRDLPQFFHNLYQQLFEYTEINSFSKKRDTEIVDIPIGRSVEDIPLPLEFCNGFVTRGGTQILFDPILPFPQGTFSTKCSVSSVEESLKMLGGDGTFHFGLDGVHEHDTFTELNSVINLIPIQTYAYKYRYFMDMDHPFGDDSFLFPEWYFTYVISDINLNISSLEAQSVSINGIVRSEDPQPSSTSYHLCRNFMFTTSTTNRFTWDRVWFNHPPKDETTIDSGFFLSSSPAVEFIGGAGPNISLGETFVNTSSFNFSEDLSLDKGNNTVRARLIIQCVRVIAMETIDLSALAPFWDNLSVEIGITGNNFTSINHDFNF